MKIVNIRGTNGAGKSTTVRGVLDRWGPWAVHEVVPGVGVRKWNRDLEPLVALGSYPPTGVGGGCDTIKTQDDVCNRVRALAPLSNVIFEGIIVTSVYQRYQALAREMAAQGHDYMTFFLHPPMDVCIDRVKARREAKGNFKPFDPVNLITKHHIVDAAIEHWRTAKLPFQILDWNDPVPQVMEFLRG